MERKWFPVLPCRAEYLGVGVMSGSSLDGLDVAAIRFRMQNSDLQGFEIVQAETYPYGAEWVDRLEGLRSAGALELAEAHVQFGHYVGQKVRAFCDKFGLRPDFMACHGHTIFHQPACGLTFQIGCGQTMVRYLDCPVVNDFRARDVACGGQGAPLAPVVESELFPTITAFLNLGGFANLSIVQGTFRIGYDLTACNRVLNFYAGRACGWAYDRNGALASKGKVSPEWLKRIEKIPYFQQPAPKSLGNEWLDAEVFPLLEVFARQEGYENVLRTWVEHIVRQVDRALQVVEGGKILITGGGAKNTFLVQRLQERLSNTFTFLPVDNQLIDFKESLIFAYLGLKTLLGIAHSNLRAITGGENTILGSIHLN